MKLTPEVTSALGSVRSETRGLARVCLHKWWTRPALQRLVLVGALLGALGSTIPQGFQGKENASGLVGGASWGAITVGALAPMLCALLAGVSVGSDQGPAIQATLYLARIRRTSRILAQGVLSIVTAGALVAAAVIGGAVGGAAAAAFTGANLLGHPEPTTIAGAVLAVAWWLLLATCAAALPKYRLAALGILVVSAPATLLLIPNLREQALGRLLLNTSPVTPWWGTIHGSGDDLYAYRPATWEMLVGFAGWPLLATILLGIVMLRKPY